MEATLEVTIKIPVTVRMTKVDVQHSPHWARYQGVIVVEGKEVPVVGTDYDWHGRTSITSMGAEPKLVIVSHDPSPA